MDALVRPHLHYVSALPQVPLASLLVQIENT